MNVNILPTEQIPKMIKFNHKFGLPSFTTA